MEEYLNDPKVWAILLAVGGLIDAISGFLPDKWVNYIGIIRRILRGFKNKKICVLFCCMTIALASCTFLTPKVRWCNQIPEGEYSIICEIAHAVNTEPEEIALSLKLANIAGLSIPLYTARQADNFFVDIQDKATEGRRLGNVTYEDLIRYALSKYDALPPAVQALIIISEDYYRLDLPAIKYKSLSRYDWDGIDKHIMDQRKLILPFLIQ